ncbi:ubiquitin carboxyl-terminal hydrolase 12 isoform X2 [Medicago truncatula]|uniref:ubiquitin carboxyl-terminal hydrolase 12 isoform X2 n=1 Tax=Medicago truncatula TaxID=3880 RepID=UPI000D2F3783|nr:ubiquitin carboxyl-terminal hydrolase 12 isoform X2 [Medicago truncatula]
MGGSKYERRTSLTAPGIQSYTWRTERFSRVRATVLYSDVFEAGGYKWRAIIHPRGNNTDYLSIYLCTADSASLPDGWSSYVEFTLKVVNQIEYKYSVTKVAKHKFTKLISDWGHKNVIPLGILFDPSRGYLVNDTLVVEIEVTYSEDEKDTAAHLRERLKKDWEVKKLKNKEKEDAQLYTIIKVIRDEDLAEQIGKDIYFNLVDHGKVRSFCVQKQTSFNVFKEEVAKEFGIPARFQRFWLWAKRLNHTYRPFRPLTYIEEAAPVGQFRDVFGIHIAELELFLEVERGPDLRPIAPLKKRKDDILLFFKLYDPERMELRYVGRLLVNCTDKPSQILTKLNKLAGYDPDEEIELYEEVFEPNVKCLPVDMKLTFQESELENGDIICFQKASKMNKEKHFRYPDVRSYLEYVHNLQFPFSPSAEETKDEESLEEQNKNSLAEETNVDKNEAQQSKVDLETTNDEGTSKANNSKFVGIDFEKINDMILEELRISLLQQTNVDKSAKGQPEKVDIETTHNEGSSKASSSQKISLDLKDIDAMIGEDVIAAIDKVLSEGNTISLQFQHSVQGQEEVAKLDPSLPKQLLQELRDIAFKEDLVEKLKEGISPKVNFNTVKEKIDANADAFTSRQLEQVGVVVNLLNTIVKVFEKLENLKKERALTKESTDQDNEALKETRQKILTSKTSLTNHQTQRNSLDAQIADLKAKLEKLQGDRAKIDEIEDQEKDKITSFNKEVKSIFHRLANDQIKLKSVEDKIPEAQTELESHEKVYRIFRAIPPF